MRIVSDVVVVLLVGVDVMGEEVVSRSIVLLLLVLEAASRSWLVGYEVWVERKVKSFRDGGDVVVVGGVGCGRCC